MTALTPEGRKIVADYQSTPAQYCAVTEDYDGAPDAGWPSNCIGRGRTEAEAIADLLDRLEDA